MKKYLFAMFGALLALTACTTDKPGNDGNKNEEEDDYITMYVASEVSSERNPFIGGPSYIVKFAEDGQWQLLGTSLVQFIFEQGYECTVRVEKKMTDPSLADGPAWFYICREVLTKEKKDSVIPENLL